MQYLLTEQEFRALKDEQQRRIEADEEQLQAFCTLAAMHIPVIREWSHDKRPRPWGCILGPQEQRPCYCDDCPSAAFCPYPHKEWSQ